MNTRRFGRYLLSTTMIAAIAPAWAGTWQYGAFTPITEPMPAAGNEFGSGQSNGAVLSADGRTALVAAPFATVGAASAAGKAYIYRRIRNSWTLVQEINDPDGAANDNFGYALALSLHGKYALMGSAASVNGKAYAGKAYLYTRSNGGWRRTREFDDPAAAANDFFGYSGVALSAHGRTAIIGAFGTTVNAHVDAGAAYVFRKSRGRWTQTAALQDPDDSASDFFGYPLALSADGRRALIGSQAAVNGQAAAGKAYLFDRAATGWKTSHEFDDPASTADDFFGDSGVSLSADGTTAAIGAVGTHVHGNAFAGAAYVFDASNHTWTQSAALADPDGAGGDAFGYPVALAPGGATLLIGSDAPVNGQAGAGKAYVFYKTAGGMWVKAHEFDDPAATAGDNFGDSGVAISWRGNVFISAYGTAVDNLKNAGAAYFWAPPTIQF